MPIYLPLSLVVEVEPLGFVPQDPQSFEVRFHRVHLKNGNFIDADLKKENQDNVVLGFRFGEMVIRKDLIDRNREGQLRIEFVKMRSFGERPKEVGELHPPEGRPRLGSSPKPETPATEKPIGNRPPSVSVKGVSAASRGHIDVLIDLWRTSRGEEPEDLAGELELLGSEVVPYLDALLDHRGRRFPVEAVCIALGRNGSRRAILPLGRLLRSESWSDRSAAVAGLAVMAAEEAAQHLVTALDDAAVEVRMAASQALIERFRRGAARDLPSTLVSRLKEAKDKTYFAITLGRLGGPEAHEGLLDLLRDRDEDSKLAAIQGLTELADPEDGPTIHLLLGASPLAVQKQACLWLGKLKYRAAVPVLIGILKEEDGGLVSNAHWALRQITGQELAADAEVWKGWWEGSGGKKKD